MIVWVSGEPVPRSLEGLFVYEEKSTAPPANDTIVVEQWTVIEVGKKLIIMRLFFFYCVITSNMLMKKQTMSWPHLTIFSLTRTNFTLLFYKKSTTRNAAKIW